MTDKRFCQIVLAVAAAETLFWLYTFYYIDHRTNPMGDGLEWMAEVPMTMIFLFGTLPALILGLVGFRFRWAAIAAALFAAGAAITDAVIWMQILGEFAHKTVR
jgi:glucan phosphoethanolaminetransferase (alkaline phosphatase superfamily)